MTFCVSSGSITTLVGKLRYVVKSFLSERKKKERKKEGKKVSDLFLGSRKPQGMFASILSTCLVCDFVDSLAIILLIHNYGKLEISLAISK